MRHVLAPLLALACLAGAAEGGVSLSPLQQEVTVAPGRAADFSLALNNVHRARWGRHAQVRLEVVDFAVSPDGTLSFGAECAHDRSAADWISLEANELALQPGESRSLSGQVAAPFAADGDYWAAVMMTIVDPRRQQGVNVVLRTASAVFVHVTRRQYRPRAAVRELELALPRFDLGPQDAGPPALTVRVSIANEGVVAFKAGGEAVVYADGRRRVATIPLHARRRRILPGDTRLFVGVLPAPLPAGRYLVRCHVATGPKGAPRTFEEAPLGVEAALASRWAAQEAEQPAAFLAVEPAELTHEAAPGRFAAWPLQVVNPGGGTMAVRCEQGQGSLPADWLELWPEEFTLGPRMRRSVICRVRVPHDAEPGDYETGVLIHARRAHLAREAAGEPRLVPFRLKVTQ
jgi:hypothetical protein